MLFLFFALNGMSENFFHTSLFNDNEIISGISIFSGIIFMVWVLTAPMVWFAHKLNERKLQREDDAIAGRTSSVKEIDFTYLLIALLLVRLVYFFIKAFNL